MAALASDFTDHNVLIYDIDSNHLGNTTITSHDKINKQIQVTRVPFGLNINDECKLLILSSPAPCEYHGKLKKTGGAYIIAMFQGQVKESRGAARYPVNTPAIVDALIIDGKPHTLQNPIKVTLINISTTGVRFRAPFYSFESGDIFRMHLIISNNRKQITAEVTNCVDNKQIATDYGCHFLVVE